MRGLLPEDVVEAPELLVPASLEPSPQALRVALVVANPELLNELGRQQDPPHLAGARQLLQHAHRLERAVDQYRRELDRARTLRERSFDDLPF
jgi:histidinol-phosphate/aromatic aminotransferase/cobyric acid decarboxylase-like protein